MSIAAVMVHVDVERDCGRRVDLAIGLADRFKAALIGVAGLAMRPAFIAGAVAVYTEPDRRDIAMVSGRLEEIGRKFCAQGRSLEQIEWRTALEYPAALLAREARAADLLVVGPRRVGGRLDDLVDPGMAILRAGRRVLVVPETVGTLALRRAVVAWKDTRECRRAVNDALPLLQQAEEVLVVEIGEDGTKSDARKHLADVTAYLVRHKVIVAEEIWRAARSPPAGELLRVVGDEQADLIVAGGYGHSRLGEWIFGGVTHGLLTSSPVCCMFSH